MAYAHVQSTSAVWSAVSSATLPYTSDVAAGNLLVVGIAIWVLTPSVVSWSVGSTAAPVSRNSAVRSAGERCYIYSAENSSAGPHTLSVTLSGTNNVTLAVHEYSGLLISGAYDVGANSGAGTGTAVSSGNTITLAQANNLLFGLTTNGGSGVVTQTSSTLNVRQAQNDNAAQVLASGDRRLTATTATNAAFTLGASSPWECCASVFKEAPIIPYPRTLAYRWQ